MAAPPPPPPVVDEKLLPEAEPLPEELLLTSDEAANGRLHLKMEKIASLEAEEQVRLRLLDRVRCPFTKCLSRERRAGLESRGKASLEPGRYSPNYAWVERHQPAVNVRRCSLPDRGGWAQGSGGSELRAQTAMRRHLATFKFER